MQARSVVDWIGEGIAGVAIAFATGEVAVRWSSLPARIPTHFDASGQVNGWGGKEMLLLLVGSTILIGILLTVAETNQRLINIPISVDRESPEVRQILRSMVIAMKAVISLSFAWIVDGTIRGSGLGRAFLPVFLTTTLAPVIYFLLKLRATRQARQPRAGQY